MSFILRPLFRSLAGRGKAQEANVDGNLKKQIIYANFHARFMSMIIDFIIIFSLFSPILSLILGYFFDQNAHVAFMKEFSQNGGLQADASFSDLWQNEKFRDFFIEQGFIWQIIASILTNLGVLMAYFTSFYYLKQASPGQMLISLKIVNEKLEKPGLARLILRNFFAFFSGLFFFLGFFWILISRKNQAFHDVIAATYVIKK